eukprot:4663266-Pyramimonas_sp.AAC.1
MPSGASNSEISTCVYAVLESSLIVPKRGPVALVYRYSNRTRNFQQHYGDASVQITGSTH